MRSSYSYSSLFIYYTAFFYCLFEKLNYAKYNSCQKKEIPSLCSLFVMLCVLVCYERECSGKANGAVETIVVSVMKSWNAEICPDE